MEAKVIIVSAKKSNKSENTVWAVAITGEEKPQAYCKSAYKAMRFAYLLKKRSGLNISENCLARLSHEIAGLKAAKPAQEPEKAQEPAENTEVVKAEKPEPKAEQPKKKARKPRTKKSAQVVALS